MNLVDFVPNYVPIGADKIFNGEGTRTCGYLRNKFIFLPVLQEPSFFLSNTTACYLFDISIL